ncbi:DnaJ protein [Plasmodium brasilianum]|uniref:DnaJ protein, putative n=2 Tax=Plasmodium (Plasmodium) TaxID=418103 RepID=A0A1A8WXN9_PLAMA|nr:DnaJ protein, putative [Plasmodium malariae]KAI4837294.1 DnaJ protein [Plasmodium brasilianum]SBS97135.1 DnaJ protein, putative [Plasmodium malariae]SCO93176.1 DnaJ protein, putative [Plasmodium malariae]
MTHTSGQKERTNGEARVGEESNKSIITNEFPADIDSNEILKLNSMNSENKKYFLNNYIAKIKYLSENYAKPKYYEILNVSVKSDYKSIRKSYLLLSKLLSVNKKLSSEYEECYYLIQKSYKILTDEYERFYYDVLNNYMDENVIEEERKILEKEADIIYTNKINELKNIYNKKLKDEKEKNGLIIEKALFGNLTLKDECINNCFNIEPITEDHIQGPFLDLTIILQSRVENSSLLFNDDFSFAYFCEIPKPLIKIKSETEKKKYSHILQDTEMYLYIKYKFLNIYHELIVVDRANYTLPESAHRVFGNRISGPFSPVNVIKMKHVSNSLMDNIFQFFSKNKFYITLFTTVILCAQSVKSI